MMKKLLFVSIAVLLTFGSAQADMPKQINFGIISTESSTALQKSFGPFLQDMETFLGTPVKSFFA